MRAVIYCRVSTVEQLKNFSLGSQEKQCREYCARNLYEVVEVFIERGESAKTTNRPEFQRMLSFCREKKNRIGVVVVFALDRFSREHLDHATIRALLRRSGVTLRSVREPIDDSPMGKLLENFGASIAQFENDNKAVLTILGMKAKLEAGGWPYRPPIGYLQVGSRASATLKPDPERAPHIRRAFELFSSGSYNAKQVLDMLTAEGLRTAKGKKLTLGAFRLILRNPIYAGWVEVKKWHVRSRAAFEPLISPKFYDRVQLILAGRRPASTSYTRNNPEFPLRRFVRCARCGHALTGGFSKGRRNRYPYYLCPQKGCDVRGVRRDDLHAAFRALLQRMQLRPEYLRLFREVVLDVWKRKGAETASRLLTISRRIDELNTKKSQLIDAFVYRRVISEAAYREEEARVDAELLAARLDETEAKGDELDIEAVLLFAEQVLSDTARLWSEFNLDQKQRLQRVLFPDGLRFGDGEFETASTSSIFTVLREITSAETSLASPTGFEPVLPP